MSDPATRRPRYLRLSSVAVAGTAVLTPLVAAVGWLRWEPLERVWWGLGWPPVAPEALYWLRLANITPVLLLGPGLLLIVRWRTRGGASTWVFLPVALLLAWGLAVGVMPHPPVEPPDPGDVELMAYKPVIYLYPESTQTVRVSLDLDGRLTECEPATDSGTTAWTVGASPDGRLVSALDGQEYPYIYWEGALGIEPDMTEGFVVARAAMEDFLQDALAHQGLSARERADFVEYWHPRMAAYPFVLVRFEQERYENAARLETSPLADTTVRVFMLFRGIERPIAVTPQSLPEAPARNGFVVVEWGGAEVQ